MAGKGRRPGWVLPARALMEKPVFWVQGDAAGPRARLRIARRRACDPLHRLRPGVQPSQLQVQRPCPR